MMRRSIVSATAVTAVLALLVAIAAAALPVRGGASPAVNYHLARTVQLAGEGGWDYLTYDPVGKRLFISRGTQVIVVDPAAGILIGVIPDTPGVHGIALAQDQGKGFTSNGRDNSLSVFDLKTLKTTAKVTIDARNPDAIIYEPVSKRVFTGNGSSQNVTAIDAVTNAVVGNVALPGRPEFAAAGNGMVYFNIEDKNEIVAIDARKNAIVSTWSLGTCDGPAGLSMDVAHHRLFSGCQNNVMMVVNSDTGAIVATLPIGRGSDATAFDPGTQLAFSSNGDGTLTVAREDSPSAFVVVQNAATQAGARTLAVDTTTHDVYLVTAQFTVGTPPPGQTRPSRTMVPGSFTMLVMSSRP
jgi:DNA-binding beta-propeller fold protein YncE